MTHTHTTPVAGTKHCQKRALKNGKRYHKPESHAEHLAAVKGAGDAAADMVDVLIENAHFCFTRYNKRLLEIHHELRNKQLKYEMALVLNRSGIALELYNCGKDCLGCPHVRWIRYHWTEVALTKANPEHKFRAVGHLLKSNPVLSIPRGAKNRQELVSLVHEGQEICQERAKLLRLFSQLRKFMPAVK